MKKTTSKLNLTADNGLGPLGKIKWLIYNLINNLSPTSDIDHSIVKEIYRVSNDENFNKVSVSASPARKLCDLFWMDIEWDQIAKDLGGQIKAIEIGAGTGYYGKLIQSLAKDNLDSYTGIDIYEDKQWKENLRDPKFKFILGDASSVLNELSNVNFIFTQSALEHFEDDLLFFEQVAEYVNKSSEPIIQIHLMPSQDCISTFPWHGYRQYNPRNISKITKLFNSNTKKSLISLGSKRSNSVHRKFITIPMLLKRVDNRKLHSKKYNEEAFNAIRQDEIDPKSNCATFYALVMKTNTKYF
jgi:hypothetical protein